MFFSRNTVGVEINPAGVSAALVGGTQSSPRLERVASRPLTPGAMRTSLREPNILDSKLMADGLREVHALLLHRGNRISLTLPDGVGRILLMDVESRFKNRNEGLDVIRWKLKKSMPFDVAESHLDYQTLTVRENGDMSLLVAMVSRTVIGQYEDLVTSAGLVPARIDLNLFCLCRAFEQRLSLLDNVVLITFYQNTLGIVAFKDGIPEFIRVKDLPRSTAVDSRLFMEVNNSLLVYRERSPDYQPDKVACIAAPAVARDFAAMVSEATGKEPLLLEAKSAIRPSNSAPADQESLFPYTAAIGAALRSL